MGLDVSAYSKIKIIPGVVYDDEGEPLDPETKEPLDYDKYFRANKNDAFPGRADEIEDRSWYAFEESDEMRAGSYGGYNRWRDQLAELAGYPLGKFKDGYGERESHAVACWNGEQGPFSELINFADNEGVIGAAVSKKLANDFAAFQTKADAHPDDYFKSKYAEWRKMFELASDGGCVKFH